MMEVIIIVMAIMIVMMVVVVMIVMMFVMIVVLVIVMVRDGGHVRLMATPGVNLTNFIITVWLHGVKVQ